MADDDLVSQAMHDRMKLLEFRLKYESLPDTLPPDLVQAYIERPAKLFAEKISKDPFYTDRMGVGICVRVAEEWIYSSVVEGVSENTKQLLSGALGYAIFKEVTGEG